MPLYDAFGPTIEIVLLGNPQIVANYSYDPYGCKVNSGYRSPFPFLFHGLEQEYYDSQLLYWEPNGNVYNPDPFELSLIPARKASAVAAGPSRAPSVAPEVVAEEFRTRLSIQSSTLRNQSLRRSTRK